MQTASKSSATAPPPATASRTKLNDYLSCNLELLGNIKMLAEAPFSDQAEELMTAIKTGVEAKKQLYRRITLGDSKLPYSTETDAQAVALCNYVVEQCRINQEKLAKIAENMRFFDQMDRIMQIMQRYSAARSDLGDSYTRIFNSHNGTWGEVYWAAGSAREVRSGLRSQAIELRPPKGAEDVRSQFIFINERRHQLLRDCADRRPVRRKRGSVHGRPALRRGQADEQCNCAAIWRS
ncbi:MAG: hypothetical protein N3A57_00445 [Negativicutes bacterium]|nr:hypothetical protein [Negativicutes bacterium]